MSPTTKNEWHYHRSPKGKKVYSHRLLAYDTSKGTDKILALENVPTQLKDGDPEMDMESAGRRIRTNNIVVDKDMNPVYTYKAFDILVKPNIKPIERPHVVREANVNATLPVRLTEKMVDPAELMTRYIFRKTYFLWHQDGASYKFLYDLAKRLAEQKKFVRLQAYDQDAKKTAPLILYPRATPYPAAFLEGRIDGDKYCLLLHLADREFKIPDKEIEEQEESGGAST